MILFAIGFLCTSTTCTKSPPEKKNCFDYDVTLNPDASFSGWLRGILEADYNCTSLNGLSQTAHISSAETANGDITECNTRIYRHLWVAHYDASFYHHYIDTKVRLYSLNEFNPNVYLLSKEVQYDADTTALEINTISNFDSLFTSLAITNLNESRVLINYKALNNQDEYHYLTCDTCFKESGPLTIGRSNYEKTYTLYNPVNIRYGNAGAIIKMWLNPARGLIQYQTKNMDIWKIDFYK